MKSIEPLLKQTLIRTLSLAFQDNSSVKMITGDSPEADIRREQLMRYAMQRCWSFGKVITNDDQNAFALVLFPDKIRFSFLSIFRDLQLVFYVIGFFDLFKVMRKEAMLKRLRPIENLYYLWFIGVSPPDQGNGHGSALLKELCADAAVLGRQICLETSVARNLSWYKAHGFEVYYTLDIDDFPLYFLSRH
jgi:ribosomal protein S18 acetylase RimI-like enzyme